jgi:hypothetical protein
MFDFALQLDEICTNLLCSLLQRFDTTLIIWYMLYETYQDFYVRRLLTIIQNCQISTQSYCLAGTDSKLKGIEQALEEVQVSRLYMIFTYDG